jgi:hypothetical protein
LSDCPISKSDLLPFPDRAFGMSRIAFAVPDHQQQIIFCDSRDRIQSTYCPAGKLTTTKKNHRLTHPATKIGCISTVSQIHFANSSILQAKTYSSRRYFSGKFIA